MLIPVVQLTQESSKEGLDPRGVVRYRDTRVRRYPAEKDQS